MNFNGEVAAALNDKKPIVALESTVIAIVGRAMFVYWSCDRGASGGSMLGCVTNPRLDRIGKMIK